MFSEPNGNSPRTSSATSELLGSSARRVGEMRFIVVGAGAVGGVVAANLALADFPVVAVARGEHGRAMSERGLRFESPARSFVVQLPVAMSVAEADVTADDVVLLAVKSQDTAGVLHDLRAAGVADVPIVCLQNGVDNERQALRFFPDVYGVYVMLPADHLTPGVVRVWTAPRSGLLDLGRYPNGIDDRSRSLAAAFNAATFSSIPRDDIMSWKHRKLLINLYNTIEAVCGRAAIRGKLGELVRAEGEAVLAAAGLDVVEAETELARRDGALTIQPVSGQDERSGGSTWQSLQRGSASIESDYLNGEIVLLGRLHGVLTPANAALQALATRMALAGEAPGSRSADDVFALMGGA